MKLSIITINLNNKVGLQKTIDSVIAQTHKDFEWIIIDGGSIDGSVELIKETSQHLNYWISEPDNGIYNAMNKGIQASSGEYLLFLNSGDYLCNEDVLCDVVPSLKGKDYYIGSVKFGSEKYAVEISNYDDLVFYAVRFLPHQGTFMHRKVFDNYGLYDENLRIVGDWVFFYKSIIFGKIEAETLPFIISVCELGGVSMRESAKAKIEVDIARQQNQGVYTLARFYKENYEKITALNDSRWMYFIFRVCYWIYRKLN